MSPARTTTDDNLGALVRRIVLDISLLHFFANKRGKSLAAITAIEQARREATTMQRRVLDFLHQHVTGGHVDG